MLAQAQIHRLQTTQTERIHTMNLETFLAQSARLEHEAELIYHKAAAVMDAEQNRHAVAFFQEMSGYSHKHLQCVLERAGIADIAELSHADGRADGTNGIAPESLTPLPSPTDIIDLDTAINMALDAEHRAAAFYDNVACTSSDEEVRRLAWEFAEEERAHVLALERLLGLKPY